MIRQIKDFTVKIVAGANVAVIIVMFIVGFADYVNPERYPLLSTAGLAFPFFLIVNLAFLVFWAVFRLRMVIIPVLGYLVCYVPISIYMPVNMKRDVPKDCIKVMTWNVQAYSGEPRYDDAFEMIFGYIKKQNADIVCVQEDLGGWRDSRARFDSLYAYSDTSFVSNSSGTNAVGIYSRYPIVRREKIDYVSAANLSVAYYLKRQRDTLLVIVNHFETTHLSRTDRKRYKEMMKGKMGKDTMREESKKLLHTLAESNKLRAPQARAVHEYVESHRQYPIIVCGDFNDNPISYTRRMVAKGLTDCYVESGRGVGLSYNQKGFFVRIDNILCSDNFEPYNCYVDNKIDASDHYPMICWLKFDKKH